MDWQLSNNSIGVFNSLVWSNADDEVYGRPLGVYPSFLTRLQQATCERVRQARMLYRGRHQRYFLGEQRTQSDFKVYDANGRRIQPYYSINVLRLISRKTADLLFGEDPEIKVEDVIQQQRIHDLSERSALAELWKDAAIMASWGGQVYLESCVEEGAVYLQAVAPDECFGVGSPGPDRQYREYVRYQLTLGMKEDSNGRPVRLLLETHYRAGANERLAWRFDDGGGRTSLTLAQWAAISGMPEPAEKESTGLPWPTITWIPNELEEGEPVSDYDGKVGQQDLLNAKQTQIAVVLAQHTDPAMAFPADAFDEQGNINSKYKAFAKRSKDDVPEYITWDAQLDAAMKEKSFVLSSLLIMAEMSPALLGLKEGAAPDAYKKLRLEASNSLAMAGRKAKTWRAGIRLAIETAQALDQSIPGNRYDRQPIGVNLRDGIPIDEKEQAETIALLRGAKVQSQERAVSLLIPDQAGQQKELAELGDEEAAAVAAATPSVLLNEGAAAGNDQNANEAIMGKLPVPPGEAA